MTSSDHYTLEDESSWFPSAPRVFPCTLGPDWELTMEGRAPRDEFGKDSSVLYALVTRADAPVPRVNGRRSRLLYVGMGRGARPLSLVDGGHSANRALDGVRRGLVGPEGRLPVELWVARSENCALQEVVVLNRCIQEYGELPPANLRWEGYLSGETLRRLARWALDEHPIKGARVDVYEWPDYDKEGRAPTSVWADVMVERTWNFSLGWFFTPALLRGRSGALSGKYNGQLLLIEAGKGVNALDGDADFGYWSRGRLLGPVEAAELDGISHAIEQIQAWLERYTSNKAWKKGNSAFETLERTFAVERRKP